MGRKEDIEFGAQSERSMIDRLNKIYSCNLEFTDKWDEFDFVDKSKKIIVELKSRRVRKTQYFDTMVGYNKISRGLKYMKDGYTVYFIFKFSDSICEYNLKNGLNRNWIRLGGRKDRECVEVKLYAFIPIDRLSEKSNYMDDYLEDFMNDLKI